MPLHSLSFFTSGATADLRHGAVARQVAKSSGCSTHSLWGTPASASLAASALSWGSPFISSTTYRGQPGAREGRGHIGVAANLCPPSRLRRGCDLPVLRRRAAEQVRQRSWVAIRDRATPRDSCNCSYTAAAEWWSEVVHMPLRYPLMQPLTHQSVLRTLCMWSIFSGAQYSCVVANSRLPHSAAVAAWHPCATTLPSGQSSSVHRSRRSTTYCSRGSGGAAPPLVLLGPVAAAADSLLPGAAAAAMPRAAGAFAASNRPFCVFELTAGGAAACCEPEGSERVECSRFAQRETVCAQLTVPQLANLSMRWPGGK